jgi:DNA repair protein RadC
MTDVIRDLPRAERPRERMMMHGVATLSDAELLAVILGSGVSGLNAIQLARQLLADGMRNLRRRELTHLVNVHGVGPAKAARIAAMFEMSRRITSEQPEDPPAFDVTVLGRKLVGSYGHQTQERLGAVFLDSRHRIRKQREIYVGTINNALVSTRDIIRYTLLERTTAVVIYHNHPSGDPNPSDEDLKFTRKLQDSLAMVDIELVDHLIIGSHRFRSLQQGGYLEKPKN